MLNINKKTSTEVVPLSLRAANDEKQNSAESSFWQKLSGRVSARQKIVFTRNLSAMLRVGLPLATALQALERQTPNRRLKKILAEAEKNITVGKTFSSTLKNHPKIFNEIFVSAVNSGEKNNELKNTFRQLSIFLEKENQLRLLKRQAIIYPLLTPLFNFFFRICLKLRARPGKLFSLVQKENLARLFLSLSTLLKTGVALVPALNITARFVKNSTYRRTLFSMAEEIKKGEKLSVSLQNYSGLFPPTVSQMIFVGENSGDLGGVVTELTDFYTEESRQELENFSRAAWKFLSLVIKTGLIVVLSLILITLVCLKFS